MEIKRLLINTLQRNNSTKDYNNNKNKKKRLSKWRNKWNQSKLFTKTTLDSPSSSTSSTSSYIYESTLPSTIQQQRAPHPFSVQKRHSIGELQQPVNNNNNNDNWSIHSSIHSNENRHHHHQYERGNMIQRPFSCILTTNHHPHLSVPHVIGELRSTTPLPHSISNSTSCYTSSSSVYSELFLFQPSSLYDEKENNENDIKGQDLHEQSSEDHFTTSTTLHQHDSKYDVYQKDQVSTPPPSSSSSSGHHHKELVIMNVNNMKMMMREHQLELELAKMKIENQHLQQQMDDIANGTWTSTTQLLEENERLEREIDQLKRSAMLEKNEEEALRHTRAQLGLIEYLEGEPDLLDALKRFKQLLISSTDLY
ncbi:hypothetical protein BJ944DRAFT_244726 [Cunninghamella echinulata]|nr:hypothetical protein BJ944DRAFT_244726 [Cunninghamella echinulata]